MITDIVIDHEGAATRRYDSGQLAYHQSHFSKVARHERDEIAVTQIVGFLFENTQGFLQSGLVVGHLEGMLEYGRSTVFSEQQFPFGLVFHGC